MTSAAEPISHDGELCSLDAFLKVYGIEDRALDALAVIVRGADTARLEHGMVMYDAFYAWCCSLQGETHNWTPPVSA